ncbi:hypothetical protein BDC45DRAFT_427348, partial [Circinella umbellata]
SAQTNMDLSLRQILERYKDDFEILKHVLTAKVEEDKKITAQDTLKIEQARIQLRELDLELMREHGQATIRYYDTKQQQQQQQPTAYPHSAHPLCLPSSSSSDTARRNNYHLSHDQVMEALKAKIQRG